MSHTLAMPDAYMGFVSVAGITFLWWLFVFVIVSQNLAVYTVY